jgi:hypothetical protein
MIGLSVFAQRGFQNEELRNDPLFTELVDKSIGLTKQIDETCRKRGISLEQLQQEVQQLQSEKTSSPDEVLRRMDQLIGMNTKYTYSEFYNSLVRNWGLIKEKYGSRLTDDYIKAEADAAAKSIYSIDDGSGYDCRDKWGYTKCAAAATAAAIIGHAACTATIFGIPVCVALVGTIQVAAIGECQRSWCL